MEFQLNITLCLIHNLCHVQPYHHSTKETSQLNNTCWKALPPKPINSTPINSVNMAAKLIEPTPNRATNIGESRPASSNNISDETSGNDGTRKSNACIFILSFHLVYQYPSRQYADVVE